MSVGRGASRLFAIRRGRGHARGHEQIRRDGPVPGSRSAHQRAGCRTGQEHGGKEAAGVDSSLGIERGRVPEPRGDREAMMIRLQELTQEARERGRAPGTKIVGRTHVQYWEEYCKVVGICGESFRSLVASGYGGQVSVEQVNSEQEIFAAFATYVVYYPRRKGHVLNSAAYVEQCVSSVRVHYAEMTGRRPGLRETSVGSPIFARMLKGLHKLSPSKNATSEPVMQHHLRSVRE